MEATIKTFDVWGLRHSGLFTFPYSAKHVGLYQRFGYSPRYLTAIMMRTPEKSANAPVLLSAMNRGTRQQAIEACSRITHRIDKGLDLTGEIRAVLAHHTGDIVATYTRSALDAFAVCMNGPGSEGGEKICYIKFAAARSSAGTAENIQVSVCRYRKGYGLRVQLRSGRCKTLTTSVDWIDDLDSIVEALNRFLYRPHHAKQSRT